MPGACLRLKAQAVEAAPQRRLLSLNPRQDRARRLGAIERVEVDRVYAARAQSLHQRGDDIGAELADAIDIVAKAAQAALDPARDFGAADVGESLELRVV